MPIQATPRNKLLGLLADGIQGVNDFARKPFGYDNPPAGLLMDALSVPAVAATVDRLSYGEPLTTGKGFTRKMRPDTVETALALAPAAVKYPKQTAGIVGGLLGVADTGAVNKAATVWHGSPHKFEKFDASKTGTGEGKQQQGFGAYLAEAQAVGQKYADKEAWKRGMDSGYLYKVDAPDEMISKMANHEAPLSAQPQSVRVAIESMIGDSERRALRDYHGWEDPQDAPFSAVMDALEIVRGNNRAATSESLRQAGIPGIRYLDGGSRGAGGGTSNFVVFPGNEGLLTILERNGQPISAASRPAKPVNPIGLLSGEGLGAPNNGGAPRSTLDSVTSPWVDQGVKLDVLESKSRPTMTLSRLVVPDSQRGSGVGSKVMDDLTRYADESGKTIALTPSTDFGGSSVARLKDFYKRFGFVENKGKMKDYEVSESMYRKPAKAAD